MMCENPYLREKNPVPGMLSIPRERDRATPFPCGQCIQCRINFKREWTHRILLEATCHKNSSFVTLTYNDDFVPYKCNLIRKDLQLFIKRLRRLLEPRKIRYLAVGEYGFKGTKRPVNPHYHLAIFGLRMDEIQAVKMAWVHVERNVKKDFKVPMGRVHLGDITKDSAQYIVGYVLKGINKKNSTNTEWVKQHLRDVLGLRREFMLMSRQNGGIGFGAVEKIAKNLLENEYFKKRLIKSLKYGNKKELPLGRYLTKKLSEELKLSQTEIDLHYYNWQQDLFDSYLANFDKDFLGNMLDGFKGKRDSRKGKEEIFKKRKIL